MKKLLILLSAFMVTGVAHAAILSNTYSNNGYPNMYRGNYYPNNRPPRYNRYPYQQPVIYRTNVNRRLTNFDEKSVSNNNALIENLENKIFNQVYDYDSTATRIERLENKMFGASQTGDLNDRLDLLKTASKNYKAYSAEPVYGYNNNQYRPPIFTGSTGGGWKNMLWGNLRNQLTGTPTGFTPAMDPAYMDYFEAERAMMGSGQQSGYQTNKGYGYSNSSRGSGTGVTILD